MPTVQDEKIRLTCPACDQTYRIRREKIPPGSTAVRCKACGKRLQLELYPEMTSANCDTSGSAPFPDKIIEKPSVTAPRCRLDLMTEEKRPRPHRKHRSK